MNKFKSIFLSIVTATAFCVQSPAQNDIDLSAYPTLTTVKAAWAACTNSVQRNEYLDSLPQETRSTYFTEATNAIEALAIGGTNVHWSLSRIAHNPTLFSQVFASREDLLDLDTRLASRGASYFNPSSIDVIKNSPLLHQAAINDPTSSLARRRYTVYYATVMNDTCRTIPGILNRIVEQLASYCLKDDEFHNKMRWLCKIVVKDVKMYLRKHGKTFVVGPEGRNPVQEAVDDLISTFEAPRLVGVKEWVAKYYPDYTWIDPFAEELTDEEVEEFKNNVFYGQIEMNDAVSRKLLYFLGKNAYNDFVQAFNSDSDAENNGNN